MVDLLESGDDSSDSDGNDDDEDDDDDESGNEENEENKPPMEIIDKTETNLVALRRLIYLTIQSRFNQSIFL